MKRIIIPIFTLLFLSSIPTQGWFNYRKRKLKLKKKDQQKTNDKKQQKATPKSKDEKKATLKIKPVDNPPDLGFR